MMNINRGVAFVLAAVVFIAIVVVVLIGGF